MHNSKRVFAKTLGIFTVAICLAAFNFMFGVNNMANAAEIKSFNLTNDLRETDPEVAAIVNQFMLEEVKSEPNAKLPETTRWKAILATLLGCQGIDAFRNSLDDALAAGVTPVEIKEITYQAIDYLGIGRVYPFLQATNECFRRKNISLPLASQSTVTPSNRLEKGAQAQLDIFGEPMRDYYKSGPEDTRHIRRWLSTNCFGDYYTRKGLDYKDREMITFCYIAAQGGCEPQLTGHAEANILVGNDKKFLIAVVSNCLSYIGYPRSLNAISCVEAAAKKVVGNK